MALYQQIEDITCLLTYLSTPNTTIDVHMTKFTTDTLKLVSDLKFQVQTYRPTYHRSSLSIISYTLDDLLYIIAQLKEQPAINDKTQTTRWTEIQQIVSSNTYGDN